MEEVIKKLEELNALQADQTRLLEELARSLRIRELWPTAFEYGSVKSTVTGNPDRTLTYLITRTDGSSRSFDLADVPVELWPESVKQDIGTLRTNPTRYKRILREAKGEK